MITRTSRLGTTARLIAAGVLLFGLAGPANAQYFGRNKVQYERFKFQVLQTAHFDIHYYPEEADAARQVALMAERWYSRLTRVLKHELTGRQPVILYASHPDFEQTNVVEGAISEGTGGVTEGGMRRVTLPLAASLAETDHVLGHELVHAFQYDILGGAIGGAPLWFIEGMAEYLSIGPRDVHTSMWLRDAVLAEKLPAIKDLDDPRYFPYRFGHAFWAYIGGRWGDGMIGMMLEGLAAGAAGRAVDPMGVIEAATERKLPELSDEWHAAIRKTYAGGAGITGSGVTVDRIFSNRTGSGAMNIGPSLSPDGSRIAFLSERDRLSIDLFLADVSTGKIIRKLIETAVDSHFESLQFLASAGAWDPTGHQLAVAAIRSGKPVLALIDTDRGGITREVKFDDLGEIFQPSWSPDGQAIAFSAQVGGYTDLFVHDLASGQTRRLTNDPYADLQPSWAPDGRRLAFVTDRFASDLKNLAFRGYGLASIASDGTAITPIGAGVPGNAITPQWSADGRALFFISDNGGRQNAYRLDIASSRVTKLTDEPTGVTGITPLSPALSVSAKGDRASVSIFRDGGYDIHILRASEEGAPVVASTVDAALLPPVGRPASVVAELLRQSTPLPEPNTIEEKEYKPKFSLVGISQQVGVTSMGSFGTYISGGISLLFSDVLGNHLLGTTFDINGGTRDMAAEVSYLNRTRRLNWGVFGSRQPLLYGTGRAGLIVIDGQLVYAEQVEYFRQTATQTGALVAYPLSRATRLEFGGAARHIGFTNEVRTQYFDPNTGVLIGEDRQDLPGQPGLQLFDTAAAIVHDTSAFGATSPIRGERFRLEYSPTFGDLRLNNITADYRRYAMPVRPVTFAGRLMHLGRYGGSSEDERLSPLFLGYPTLVRGYDTGSFEASECTPAADGSCAEFDRLIGSRILVANGEVRAPLVGLFKGRLDYGPLPVEVFGFVDSGVAWVQGERPPLPGSTNGIRRWVTSVGAGARVNLFGFAIGEFNLVKPINRPQRGWMFVFNFRPGF